MLHDREFSVLEMLLAFESQGRVTRLYQHQTEFEVYLLGPAAALTCQMSHIWKLVEGFHQMYNFIPYFLALIQMSQF